MPFIDREEELRFLEEQYASHEAALVVVYGRRRLGKTTLLERFLQEKPAIYFLASEEAERENLEEFKRLVAEFIKNPLLEKAGNLAWLDVFRELVNTQGERRVVLVMDEFQYLCMSNAAFASVFQKIWDTLLKRHNVMVVLCGSLVSMMESQTLSYSSPLYGRRTGQIRLGQIPFRFYSAFYPQLEPDELVPPRPAQLPLDIADFTGRAAQVGHLYDALTIHEAASGPGTVRVIVVAGAAGLGKTTLAVHAAH